MTISLREKRVGPYTVRELPMRETMRVLAEYPDNDPQRGVARLGAAVFNGDGKPLGLDVQDLGTGLYMALMEAFNDVSGKLEFPEDAQGNV